MIKDLRETVGLTQVEFAGMVGVSEQTISAVETGRRKPGKSLSDRMAEVLGADPDELSLFYGRVPTSVHNAVVGRRKIRLLVLQAMRVVADPGGCHER